MTLRKEVWGRCHGTQKVGLLLAETASPLAGEVSFVARPLYLPPDHRHGTCARKLQEIAAMIESYQIFA